MLKVIHIKTQIRSGFENVIRKFEQSNLKRLLLEFISLEAIGVEELSRGSIPEVKGIYAFYREQMGKPLYIGITDNIRRRVWGNHLAGNRETSTLRRKLFKTLGSEEKVSKFLRKCWIKIKQLPYIDDALLKRLEHLAIGSFLKGLKSCN